MAELIDSAPRRKRKVQMMRIIQCASCGADVETNSNFRKYCAHCADRRNLESASASSMARYWARKSGEPEKVFSCEACGTLFVGRRGKNKYCCSHCWKSAGIQGRITNAMRSGIVRGLSKGVKASRKTFEILGYTLEDLKGHIERQFIKGMTWENYGIFGWHIDHRVPLSSFHYTTMECPDFKRAWALTNLQPLWANENWSKNDRVTVLV